MSLVGELALLSTASSNCAWVRKTLCPGTNDTYIICVKRYPILILCIIDDNLCIYFIFHFI